MVLTRIYATRGLVLQRPYGHWAKLDTKAIPLCPALQSRKASCCGLRTISMAAVAAPSLTVGPVQAVSVQFFCSWMILECLQVLCERVEFILGAAADNQDQTSDQP